MNRKRQYRKNTYGMQVAFLIATIAALAATVVLGTVLIWHVLHRGGSETAKSTTSADVQTTETPDADVTADTTGTAQTADPPETTSAQTAAPAEPEITFLADLSAYEAYMNPQGEERDAYLLLVNADNPLSESYVPQNLIAVSNPRYDPPAQMVETAAKALQAMFLEMKANGYTDVTVTSGYRSYATQKSYFSGYINKEMQQDPTLTRQQAEAIVLTYSCREGTSEHQSGLCCDMHNLPSADRSFANTEVAQWLAQNSWKFGFVVRFPEDKTEVTGISYEPWHFRYVGRYHAERMYHAGMCLEEYVASLDANA